MYTNCTLLDYRHVRGHYIWPVQDLLKLYRYIVDGEVVHGGHHGKYSLVLVIQAL